VILTAETKRIKFLNKYDQKWKRKQLGGKTERFLLTAKNIHQIENHYTQSVSRRKAQAGSGRLLHGHFFRLPHGWKQQ
jgi:hypothetical protein